MILEDYSRLSNEDEAVKNEFKEFLLFSFDENNAENPNVDLEISGYHEDGPEAEAAFMRSFRGDSVLYP